MNVPHNTNAKTLTVTGKGRISASPDLVTLSCTVSAKNKNYSDLTASEAEKTSELINALAGVGFEEKDIKTSDFSLDTEYESCSAPDNKWVRQFAGYSLRREIKLEFELDPQRLNDVINAVTSCKKADPAFHISFTVKDKDGLSDLLLEKAVKDAAHKAGVIAAASEMTLGDIINISYGADTFSFDSPTLFRGAAEGAEPLRCAAKINMVPEDVVSETDVTVTYHLA